MDAAQEVVARELGVTFPMYVCPPGYAWTGGKPPRVRLLAGSEAEDVCVVILAGADEQGKVGGVETLVLGELGVDVEACRARALAMVEGNRDEIAGMS